MKNKQILPRFQHAGHFKNFWERGNGKKLIEWSGAEVNFNDFEKYAPLYFKADDLGDKVVKDFYLSKPYPEANKEIENYIRKGIPKGAMVPASVKQLFQHSEELPKWVDQRLLRLGAENCMRGGLNAFISSVEDTLKAGDKVTLATSVQ